MAKKKVRLTSENITKLTNHFKKSSEETLGEKAINKLLNDIAYDVESYLVNQTLSATRYPSTGEIAASSYARVHTPASTGRTYISIGQSHPDAKYFEYGTGFVGNSFPHPLADEVGWEYGIGENINAKGIWLYPNELGIPNPKNGKVYPSIPTEGQEAHAQLYYTREYARQRYPIMARNFFIARFRKMDF